MYQQPPLPPRAESPVRKRKRRIRWGRLALVFLLGAFFVTGLAAAVLYLYYMVSVYSPSHTPGSTPVKKGERVNILVLGVDQEGERSDTMIVLSLDPQGSGAGLMSIPRDTRVEIAGRGTIEKIAHASAYWDKNMTGTARSMKTVERLLGVPVHFFVTVNFRGFERLIDSIGGVEVEIPFDMVYEDPYQDLSINLKKGHQALDGRRALHFVRFRSNNDGTRGYPDGDLGRVQAQQNFMRAVIRKMTSAGVLVRLPVLAPDLAKYVNTNIPPNQLLLMAKVASSLTPETVKWAVLPGEPGDLVNGYYLVDEAKKEIVVDRIFRGIERQEKTPPLKVEVLNGAGIPGAAQGLADYLRDRDFEVVRIDNADRSDYRATLIINLNPGTDPAKNAQLQNLAAEVKTKSPNAQVVARSDAKLGAPDVIIIIGRDHIDPRN